MRLFRKTESSVGKFKNDLDAIKNAQKNYLARVGIDMNNRPKGVLPQLRKSPTKKKTSSESIFRG